MVVINHVAFVSDSAVLQWSISSYRPWQRIKPQTLVTLSVAVYSLILHCYYSKTLLITNLASPFTYVLTETAHPSEKFHYFPCLFVSFFLHLCIYSFVHSYIYLFIHLLTGLTSKHRTLSRVISPWNLGRTLVGLCFHDNTRVSLLCIFYAWHTDMILYLAA